MTTDPSSAGDSQQGGALLPQAPVYGQPNSGQPHHAPTHAPQPGYSQQAGQQPMHHGQAPGPAQPQAGQPYPQAPHLGHAQPQSGQTPPHAGHAQAPDYGQAPGHHQAPGAYGQPHAQGAGHAAGAAPKNEYFDFTGYRFRLPTSWPKSIAAAKPSFRTGLGSIFQTAHMPMDARIGYWIWLVGCVLAIASWFFSIAVIAYGVLISPFTLVATGMVGIFGGVRWGMVLLFVATMLFALVMLVLQLFMTLKVREGAEWARLGLTAITLASIVYTIILTVAGLESGGVGSVVLNIFSFVVVAVFWLPKANEWFLSTPDGDTPPAGPRRSARH